MSAILTFIILLAIFFIVIPVVTTFLRLWLKIREYKKFVNRAAGGTYGNGSRTDSSERPQYARGGWTYPARRRRKVYSKDEGEYVSFQEVKVTSASAPPVYQETAEETFASSRRTGASHHGPSDAEWEDI